MSTPTTPPHRAHPWPQPARRPGPSANPGKAASSTEFSPSHRSGRGHKGGQHVGREGAVTGSGHLSATRAEATQPPPVAAATLHLDATPSPTMATHRPDTAPLAPVSGRPLIMLMVLLAVALAGQAALAALCVAPPLPVRTSAVHSVRPAITSGARRAPTVVMTAFVVASGSGVATDPPPTPAPPSPASGDDTGGGFGTGPTAPHRSRPIGPDPAPASGSPAGPAHRGPRNGAPSPDQTPTHTPLSDGAPETGPATGEAPLDGPGAVPDTTAPPAPGPGGPGTGGAGTGGAGTGGAGSAGAPGAPGVGDPPWYDIPGKVAAAMTGWLAALVTGGNVPLVGVVTGLLDSSRLTGITRVQQLWQGSLQIADACVVVLILLGGLTVMTYGSVQTRWAAKEIAPRLVTGVAAAHLSWWLINTALGFSVGMAVSLAGQGLTPGQVLGGLLVNTVTSGGAFPVLLGVVVLVLAVVLVLTLIFTTVVLTLLIVAAPLALITHCLPQTEAIAHRWWRAFGATLAIPTVHGLTLALLAQVLFTPTGFSLLGLATGPLTNLLVLLALLWVMIKTPFWAWSVIKTSGPGGSSGGRSSLLGRVVRAVIAYKTLGLLAGTATAGATTAAGAGAGSSSGGVGGLLGGMARAGGTVGMLGRAGQALHRRVTTPSPSSRLFSRMQAQAATGRPAPRPRSGVGPVTFLPPPGSAPHLFRPMPAGPHGSARPEFLAPRPAPSAPTDTHEAGAAPGAASPRARPRPTVVPTFQAPADTTARSTATPRPSTETPTPSHRPRPQPGTQPGARAAKPRPRQAQAVPGFSSTTDPSTYSARPSATPNAGASRARTAPPPAPPATPVFTAPPAATPRPRRPGRGAPSATSSQGAGGRDMGGNRGYHRMPAPVTFSAPTQETSLAYRARPTHSPDPRPPAAATPAPAPSGAPARPRRRTARPATGSSSHSPRPTPGQDQK